jgi:hypothetical protein
MMRLAGHDFNGPPHGLSTDSWGQPCSIRIGQGRMTL